MVARARYAMNNFERTVMIKPRPLTQMMLHLLSNIEKSDNSLTLKNRLKTKKVLDWDFMRTYEKYRPTKNIKTSGYEKKVKAETNILHRKI